MRAAIIIVVSFLLLILQSTMLELVSVRAAAPSLGLLVVLYLGLSPKWNISSAAIVAFCAGYLLDLVAGAPQGVYAFIFVWMALAARALSTRIAVQGIVLSAATAFVASLLTAVLVVVVRAQLWPEAGYTGLRQAPFEALLTGVCAPLVLWMLRKIDGKLDTGRTRVGLKRGPRTGLGDGIGFR